MTLAFGNIDPARFQLIESPPGTATSVQLREGKRFVTDGPFAETREQLGGYFLIDADHLDQALSIAARIPMVRKGTVETRPVIDIPNLPSHSGESP